MAFWSWSRTASSNSSADATINWAEGQAPSSVNDSARAMMARTAEFRDDISGAIVTGGSSTAYTVTSFQVFDTLAHLNGQMIAFTPNATNTNAVGVDVTLNVDGLGAKPIRMAPSVALPNGSLVLGTPYLVTYNNSDAVFYLQNMTNPYNIPLGAGMDFWGTTAPNTSFAFPTGQAISRTTYATLFTLLGTTYGTGDGSTTFNLPDKTGRVSAMKEATATRLTTAGGGVDGGTIGAVGGTQNVTLAANQIPTITASNASQAISVTSTNFLLGNTTTNSGSSPGGGTQLTASDAGSGAVIGHQASSGTNSISATYTNASQVVTKTVMPAIVCNYILRII